jgi:hypothetical protein
MAKKKGMIPKMTFLYQIWQKKSNCTSSMLLKPQNLGKYNSQFIFDIIKVPVFGQKKKIKIIIIIKKPKIGQIQIFLLHITGV